MSIPIVTNAAYVETKGNKLSLDGWYTNDTPDNSVHLITEADKNNQWIKKRNVNLKNMKETVIVGQGSQVGGAGAIVVGQNAKAREGQATAVGHNSQANGQAVALGADTYAYGVSSIAIGNDDITIKYKDRLSKGTIQAIYKKLYDKSANGGNSMVEESFFNGKYLNANGGSNKDDNRKFSPTASMGIGSISIGSRAVAYGDGSTALGTLSFALSDGSTTLGLRSYVHTNATSAMALGNESRVYAKNSLAIGTRNEATNEGAMSYGYNAKAVGGSSIAIGYNVGANASIKDVNKLTTRLKANNNGSLTEIANLSNKITEATKKIKTEGTSQGLKFEEENDVILSLEEDSNGQQNNIDIKKIKKKGDGGIVIGREAFSNGDNSISVGLGSGVFSNNSIGIGSLTYIDVNAENSISIGIGATTRQQNSLALGLYAFSNAKNSMAIGLNSIANIENSIALGNRSMTDYTKSDLEQKPYVPKGAFLLPTSSQIGYISVGAKGQERRIVNVAPGSQPNDVVTVSQLQAATELLSFNKNTGKQENKIPYVSIHADNNEFTSVIEEERDWKYYVELKTMDSILKNRKQNNNEEFNQETLNELNTEITTIEKKYKNFKDKASAFNALGLNGGKGNNQYKYKENEKKIEEAKKSALAVKIITEDVRKKMEASNYSSNRATGENAIAIGINASATENNSITVGFGSEAKAEGAIAIGDGALVDTNAGDSVALGKNSKAEAKKTALSSATIPAGNGNNNIKFSWENAGTSQNQNGAKDKAVVSVGVKG
ncbi:hypothetical protein ACE4RU_08490, partial [Actinobacillus seminis]|uniref:hypothetical protein n=1 Tax=Actinobacillus seminis TaxID=722 RepID=UPI003B957B8D